MTGDGVKPAGDGNLFERDHLPGLSSSGHLSAGKPSRGREGGRIYDMEERKGG